jgi:hypothetical protein
MIRVDTRCDHVRSVCASQWESAVKIAIEIIGWTAAAMMLSAYLLLTSGRLSSSSGTYQWLNVLSGAGFIINSGWNGAYPSAFLNVIWVTIGLYGVFRGLKVRTGPAA